MVGTSRASALSVENASSGSDIAAGLHVLGGAGDCRAGLVKLNDGHSATWPWQISRSTESIHGARFSLIQDRWRPQSLAVVDASSALQAVEPRGIAIDDVALAASDRFLDGVGGLHAYSLTRFGAPARQLDDYRQTVAVLEHFGKWTTKIDEAQAAVRRLPSGLEADSVLAREHLVPVNDNRSANDLFELRAGPFRWRSPEAH